MILSMLTARIVTRLHRYPKQKTQYTHRSRSEKMRICPLLGIGFDMNLGKISAKTPGRENRGSNLRQLPCQDSAKRRVKRLMRFYRARINLRYQSCIDARRVPAKFRQIQSDALST